MLKTIGTDEVAPELRQFIAENISSVLQLEILLLLQTNRAQTWTAAALAQELRVELAGAKQTLVILADRGLIEAIGGGTDEYHYAPRSPEQERMATALAQAYLLRRVTIISHIFAQPPKNLLDFAEAFRLRKENPNG